MSSFRPLRTVLYHPLLVPFCFAAAPCACASSPDNDPNLIRIHSDNLTEVAAPPLHMSGFARLIGGEWQVTMSSGESYFNSWQWGPGQYSIRKMPYASNVIGNPWAGELIYWHPGRRQVCVLSLHEDIPEVGRGVSEGTMTFKGETAEGVFDLYQTRHHRKMGMHWAFDGPDKYLDTLLEDTGDGLKPMNRWSFFRIKERTEVRPVPAEQVPSKLPEPMKAVAPLLGSTWETVMESSEGDSVQVRSTYEWIPSLEVVHARMTASSSNGKPVSLFEAYLYHHIGTRKIRCLGLSNLGGVYEGDMTTLEGDVIQLEMKGFEDDRVVPLVVRMEFAKDHTLHSRIWSVRDAERTLLLDLHHKRSEPRND